MIRMTKTTFTVLLIAAIIAFVLAPIAFIWSVNTLFPVLAIPYSFNTWLAALAILIMFGKPSITKEKG